MSGKTRGWQPKTRGWQSKEATAELLASLAKQIDAIKAEHLVKKVRPRHPLTLERHDRRKQ